MMQRSNLSNRGGSSDLDSFLSARAGIYRGHHVFIITLLVLLLAVSGPVSAQTKWKEGGPGRSTLVPVQSPFGCANALGEDAQFLHLLQTVAVQDAEGGKELLLSMGSLAGSGNTDLVAVLRISGQCKVVLATLGRGIRVGERVVKGFPELHTYASEGRDEETGAIDTSNVTYIWNGSEYEDSALQSRIRKAKDLNAQAVRQFRQKKIEAAIRIWKQIEDELGVADAEVLNNLGFAYYELGKQNKDSRYYSHDPMEMKPAFTYYENAERYLANQ